MHYNLNIVISTLLRDLRYPPHVHVSDEPRVIHTIFHVFSVPGVIISDILLILLICMPCINGAGNATGQKTKLSLVCQDMNIHINLQGVICFDSIGIWTILSESRAYEPLYI